MKHFFKDLARPFKKLGTSRLSVYDRKAMYTDNLLVPEEKINGFDWDTLAIPPAALMSKASKIVRSWDCSESCRFEEHAQKLFAVISKTTLTDKQVACYLAKTCRNFSKISDGRGKTVLHMSAGHGRKDLCIWLITKAESNVNAGDSKSGYTPLHATLFYGHFDVAVKLIELGAKLSLLDREHLSPISLLSLDLAPIVPLSSARTEAYVYGTNLNYTLGIGTDDSKKFPEVLEFFRRNSLSIKQVCMEEFHTVFVTSCHQVYVCGHGQGGRLGIGKEKPLLIPTLLPTRGESCAQAAVGLNHTLLLLANGGVLSCGSNIHHQLGISPYVEHSSTPRYVNINATRAFGKISAVCASKYHSVFCTKKAIFACGLNAGQLGTRDNHMDFFTVPQQIAVLAREADYITLVTTSIASVSYVTSVGDIFIFHQFQHKKIMRCPGVIKLESHGGRLAPVVNGIESGEDLKLVWLTKKGSVYVWQEKKGVSLCSTGTGRILSICDISLRDDTISLVTKYGEAFSGLLRTRETAVSSEKISKNSEQNFPCWCSVNIKQIPNVHRGLSITSDPKGKNIAIIQAHPANPVGFSFTSSRPSAVTSQFSNFLEQASESDDLHDVVFVVGGAKLAAHKFILVSRGWTINILKQSIVQVPSSIPLIIFKELLKFIYCGESVLLCVGKCDQTFHETGDPIKHFCDAASYAGIDGLNKILHNYRFEEGIVYYFNDAETISSSKVLFDRTTLTSLCDVVVTCEDSSELKAHKCILSARMEYFNNMFTRGWTESTAGRKIHMQFSSKIVGWILDFLYTDKLPVSLSCDDLDTIIKLLIASDQYLIDDLKDECAIYLSEMLSLKNCTMILQLANTYNEHSLKMSVMEYIAYNLNAIIENRYLELLDESLLCELNAFCKNLFAQRYKDRAIRTMFYEEPGTAEEVIIASYEYCGTETPADFPTFMDEEDKHKLNPGKKRTPKKPIAASPPSVLNASLGPDVAPLSLSMDSTQTFSPSSSFESSFKEHEFPLLSNSFHTRASTSPPKHSFEPRRVYPPKLSQKQRKKLSSDFEEKLNISQEESKPKQTRGWAKIEPPPDISFELSSSPVSTSLPAEKSSERAGPKMVDIIAVEQQKRDNLRRMTTKPLHLTQMEEAAMQGLQEFYNVDHCFDERITIVRVLPLNVAEPTWMPLSRRLPVL